MSPPMCNRCEIGKPARLMNQKSNAPARRQVLKSDLNANRSITRATMKTQKLASLVLSLILLAGCATQLRENSRRHVLTQISTYDALFAGLYDGVAPLKSVEGCGDLGLGTLDRWNGELVLLDGEYHLVTGDGTMQTITNLNVTTPFLALAWFHADTRQSLTNGITYDQLKQKPEAFLPSINLVYAIKF